MPKTRDVEPSHDQQLEAVTDAVQKGRYDQDELGFVPLDEVDTKLKVMWYGREGTGKTTDAASMANLGPVLYINAEGGLDKGALRKQGINVANIRVAPKPGERITFDLLEKWVYRLASDLQDDAESWAGVVFDSMTEIATLLLEDITARAHKKAQRKGLDRDRFFVDRSEWGVMTEQVRLLVRRFRDLPCHFGMTALERRDVDDDTGRVMYGPAVNPGLQNSLLGYPGVVLYCKAGPLDSDENDAADVVYRALAETRGKYRAKDRTGTLPPVLVDPRFDRVVAYALGGLEERDDPQQRKLDQGVSGGAASTESPSEQDENESEE